jgi:hypothetical protein
MQKVRLDVFNSFYVAIFFLPEETVQIIEVAGPLWTIFGVP